MITTQRLSLMLMHDVPPEILLQYYADNQAHLVPWEPRREGAFYTLDYWQHQLELSRCGYHEGREYRWIAQFPDADEHDGVIGICNFTGIIRGSFQACYLGYSVGQVHEGQGYMSEMLTAAIAYMFDQVGLHRIMANYLPHNERSGQLLARLGFEREGYARDYLQIAGRWEDHILTAKVNDHYHHG